MLVADLKRRYFKVMSAKQNTTKIKISLLGEGGDGARPGHDKVLLVAHLKRRCIKVGYVGKTE